MSLTKELLGILRNSEEPLCKRLKIADNAFKSIELPIQHKEAVLLKWLRKTTRSDEPEAWNLLLNWLTSQQMQNLNKSDTKEECRLLMETIIRRIEKSNNVNAIINCAFTIMVNRSFQYFYKIEPKEYCYFVAKILLRVENEEQLCSFLKNEQLFNRDLISSERFYQCFMEEVLPHLGLIAEKFCNNKAVFQEIAKIVEKCLFHRNYKHFSGAFKLLMDEVEDTKEIPPQLHKLLCEINGFWIDYKGNLYYVYKLIFHSYCASYNNDFQIIYKFFIVLLQIAGFDMANYYKLDKLKEYESKRAKLNQSVMILKELLNVLINNTVDINAELKEITFSDLIRNLTLLILSLTKQPNENIYEYLNCLIILDPLAVEKILDNILAYIMVSNKKNMKAQYKKFFTSLFEVFVKLHRIPTIISRILAITKVALEGKYEFNKSNINLSIQYEEEELTINDPVVQDMIPNDVLNYFTQCITTLPKWQVINIFLTFRYHLEHAVATDLSRDFPRPALYAWEIGNIEIICILLSQFLCSVRVAEHTVPTLMVEKFVKIMEELKVVLSNFGSSLVKLEHNPVLMRAYLNVCYSWGELYINLAYYSSNGEVVFQRTLDSDSSACNITYLHPYLSRDQWCLISQRIANFGEKPCKQIMHKLYIQKLKALLLFEEDINEETISSIRTSILSVIDDHWRDLIFDQLVLDEIISKSNALFHIAEIVLEDIVKTYNYQQLNSFFDCKELISAMLYMCVYKLNKAFKRKQKRGTQTRISLSSKIFPSITENLFLNQTEDLQPLIETFLKEIKVEVDNSSLNKELICVVNEKDLFDYMNVIKNIPVVQYDNANIQQTLVIHFICICIDLRYSYVEYVDLIGTYESILLGLIQNCNTSLKFLVTPFDTLKIIINKFSRYLELFTLIIQNVLKNEDDLEFLNNTIQFLTKSLNQEKYLLCTVEILNAINK
ncbi:hypothetical protein ILUMI_13873, partial [Ignelater luminosus]